MGIQGVTQIAAPGLQAPILLYCVEGCVFLCGWRLVYAGFIGTVCPESFLFLLLLTLLALGRPHLQPLSDEHLLPDVPST